MPQKRKYRLKKRIKNFLIFYIFVSILFVASYTLSRYVEVTQGMGGIEIAKFNVSVNDVSVKDGTPIQFNFSESTTFLNEKVAPDSEGYFEFVINPDGTEVSLEYEFKFDLSKLDKDFKLTYFKVNDSGNYDITDGNIVKSDLLLPKTGNGFTDSDAINIKVYWSWFKEEDITNPNIEDYDNKNINVIAIVKQKIK